MATARAQRRARARPDHSATRLPRGPRHGSPPLGQDDGPARCPGRPIARVGPAPAIDVRRSDPHRHPGQVGGTDRAPATTPSSPGSSPSAARPGFEQTIWTPTRSTVGIIGGDRDERPRFRPRPRRDRRGMVAARRAARASFRPAMMCRPAAQLWITSTMGTDESIFWNGLVDDGRARVEAGERSGVAYFEWSAGDDDDPDDPETWLGCMPAIGYTVDLDTIKADHDSIEPDEFARAYLNRRQTLGRPVIAAATWAGVPRSVARTLAGLPCFSIDVTPDRSAPSIAVAGWRADRKPARRDRRPPPRYGLGDRARRRARGTVAAAPVRHRPRSPAGSLLVDLAAVGVPTETDDHPRVHASVRPDSRRRLRRIGLVHLGQPVLDAAVGRLAKASDRRLVGVGQKGRRRHFPVSGDNPVKLGINESRTRSPQIL